MQVSSGESDNMEPTQLPASPMPTFKGATGETLTAQDLPKGNMRWTVRRKVDLLNAITAGVITAAEARNRYGISEEELASWRSSYGRHGTLGLRVSHLKEYR